MERPVCNQSTVGPVMCAVSPLGTDRKFDIVNIDNRYWHLHGGYLKPDVFVDPPPEY